MIGLPVRRRLVLSGSSPAEADPGVKPVGRPGNTKEASFREKEKAILAICAGAPDVKIWRRAGTPRFMAGGATQHGRFRGLGCDQSLQALALLSHAATTS